MFDKLKKAGSLLADAAIEGYEDSKEAAVGAYQGAIAKVNGATIITKGVKEVHLTKSQLSALLNGNDTEVILDDTATDDGYDQVRVTTV